MADDVRRELRERRTSLGATEQQDRSRRVGSLAATLPWWSTARTIALYRATGGELDVGPIGDLARAEGVTTYVPVVDGDHLRFGRFDSSTGWSANRFGILEPVGTELVGASDLDLVFVPAVAVDGRGNRLGMGAGFYDRTFAALIDTIRPRPTALVAAVHDEQIIGDIEPQRWDVPMDAIITPTKVIVVSAP